MEIVTTEISVLQGWLKLKQKYFSFSSHLNMKDRAEGCSRAGGEREGAQPGDVVLSAGGEVEMTGISLLGSVGRQTGCQRQTT